MARTTLTTARKARTLRQGELAVLLDVSPTTLWKWERGTADPDPAQQLKLSAVLAVPRVELFPDLT